MTLGTWQSSMSFRIYASAHDLPSQLFRKDISSLSLKTLSLEQNSCAQLTLHIAKWKFHLSICYSSLFAIRENIEIFLLLLFMSTKFSPFFAIFVTGNALICSFWIFESSPLALVSTSSLSISSAFHVIVFFLFSS